MSSHSNSSQYGYKTNGYKPTTGPAYAPANLPRLESSAIPPKLVSPPPTPSADFAHPLQGYVTAAKDKDRG